MRDTIEWMGLLGNEGSGYLGFLTLPSGWTVVQVTGDRKSQRDHVHEEGKPVRFIPDRRSRGVSGRASGHGQQAAPVGVSPGAQERDLS